MKSNHAEEPIEIGANAHIGIVHAVFVKQTATDKRCLMLHATVVQVHETWIIHTASDADTLAIAVNDDLVAVENIGGRG